MAKPVPHTRVFDVGFPLGRISMRGNLPCLEIMEPATEEENTFYPAMSVRVHTWENLRELHDQLAAFLSEARMNGWIE